MSNIDKRALRETAEKANADNHTQDEWFHYLRCSTPATVLSLLDELEAKDRRLNEILKPNMLLPVIDDMDEDNLRHVIKTVCENYSLLHAKWEAAEKQIAERPGQKRLIGWRMADYTDETADPALAKNWATAVDVLPIFEGDVNTKLSAAMLQGAEPVTTAYKLPANTPCKDAPEHIWLQTAGIWPENGEFSELTWCSENQHPDDTLYVRADVVPGNSPVVPDGWALVPIEPTEDMIVNGFESEPDESFSDAEVWEAYDAMSGCQQAAHRAKLCWSAMISAAPKPDVR